MYKIYLWKDSEMDVMCNFHFVWEKQYTVKVHSDTDDLAPKSQMIWSQESVTGQKRGAERCISLWWI